MLFPQAAEPSLLWIAGLMGAIAATPWLASPIVLARRLGHTPSLDSVPADPVADADALRVSVIVPARNEAAHIFDCVRALRDSSWPDVEIIVVDDGSTDGTASLALDAAAGDSRVRVIAAPPLPAGWFGKQWACQSGVRESTGSMLLFTDADTRHAPDLIARAVRMRALRGADLLSVAGRQDAITIWERAVQPLVFALVLSRYGGGFAIEAAQHESDVMANGQCFMLARSLYDRIGGHDSVRRYVAEDVMIAQTVWRGGGRVSLALGLDQLSTRMYDGLRSLVRGWSKNVYAGGRHAMRGGRLGQLLFPVGLLFFPLFILAPAVALLVAAGLAVAGGVVSASLFGWMVWSALSLLGVMTAAGLMNWFNRDPWYRGLLAPLGAAVLLVIVMIALARGQSVRWKDRGYESA